jgi:hypothetical protein
MKRQILYTLALALFLLPANSQTMRVNMGNVTYAIPATQAGEMLFTDGSYLTIGTKQFTIGEISSISIDDSTVDDNTIGVSYSDDEAKVVISGNLIPYITAKVTGAHVAIDAASNLEQEVTYTLSGTSANGSFYMDGSYPMNMVLNGLTLTNPDSAAINIQDGKKIGIHLEDGTTSQLSDGLTNVADNGSDGHKAALYVDGHSSWTGTGTLNLQGKVKHAFSCDEYALLNPGFGTINVVSSINDGFHISQYFEMQGGTVNITASGDGIDVEKKKTDKDNNGMMILSGGTLNVTTSGNATKALKCESDMVVSGGFVTATTTGNAIYDAAEADISSNAAAKCDGTFTMTGGTLSLTSLGTGGKGLNATGAVTISGGDFTAVTTGGVYTYGALDTKPHAVKSDVNITLAGGNILSCASQDNGTAFKSDAYVLTNGATVMGIGGKATTPSNTSTHGFKKYTGVKVTGGSQLSYDGVTFSIPSIYNASSAKVLVSSPSM